MENTKLPAYPLPLVSNSEGEVKDASDWGGNMGFTKLELASLMIAQGAVTNGWALDRKDQFEKIVYIAKAVLEEANK